MVNDLAQSVGLQSGEVNMNISVHEDNSGALVLAEMMPPQFTPSSKYYATKTIWSSWETFLQRVYHKQHSNTSGQRSLVGKFVC